MTGFTNLYLVPRSEPETKGDDFPVSTGVSGKKLPAIFSGSHSTDTFPITTENAKRIWVHRASNGYKYCSSCHKRRTGWLVSMNDGDDRRVCAQCMTPVERRLVESIVSYNNNPAPGVRMGAESGDSP